MAEPETAASPSLHTSSRPIPWWVRLCHHLWKFAVFLGVTVFLALVVNVLSTWLTSSHGALPPDTPLTTLMTHWPITVLTGCCLLLIAALAWAISRQNLPATQASLPTAQDRERMQRRLRLRYAQMLAQSLQGAVQIELGLVSRPAVVHNAASLSLRLPDQPEEILPPHTSIREAYELAQQELLILGEPGAGKSTLLLELAHSLVEESEQDTTQPLPILLPLSSWAVSRPPLQDWLAEQLTLLYEVPRRLSQQWIQAEQVLPLLDGLDEMEASARAACIAAINTYHHDHLRPLVVCSRTDEYETAARRERLALHAAVVVQPLSPEQVESHLAHLGKPMAALRTALRKNRTLQELATTPLMLHVLLLTYHGTSVRELSQKEAELREQIWTDYVEHMVSRKGDVRRYPLHITITRLGWLAAEMRQRNQTIFFLEQLRPDWLPKRRRSLYRWSVRLVLGLGVGGLVGGLLFVLGVGLLFGLLFVLGVGGWVSGLGVGLLSGLLFVLGVGGLLAVIEHYILRFWLTRSGLFPWRAIPFLGDATARILLRRVGGGYSFAHQLLLDFFADAYAGASSASPNTTPEDCT